MRNQWILATASTVAFAGAAHGASAPPVFSWTGFYVGGNIGGASHDATTHDVSGWGSSSTPSYVTPWFKSNNSNLSFGSQVGYNWQVSSIVFGAEADVTYIGASSTFIPANSVHTNCGTNCGVSATNELTWVSTFRGRAGVAFDRFLVYATGGLAVGHVNNHWGWGFQGFSDSQFDSSENRAGYVFGGGIEAMLAPNWTVRAEAMHIDLGTSRSTISGQPVCCQPVGLFTTEFKNTANIGRVAFSYRW